MSGLSGFPGRFGGGDSKLEKQSELDYIRHWIGCVGRDAFLNTIQTAQGISNTDGCAIDGVLHDRTAVGGR